MPNFASTEDAEQAVETLLRFMGEQPTREGLRETPRRFCEAWLDDWGKSYQETRPPALKFFNEPGINYDQMVLVRDIVLYSHCEHHLAPFYGVVHIGYIPRNDLGILGLSKLARVVEHYSRRLQVQERLTQQIGSYLEPHVAGVGVVVHCKHLCMISRGVRQPNSIATTSFLRGNFYDDPGTREEFLALTRTHDAF